MQARDIMTTYVVTVAPDASVADIAATLVDNRISAVPVVDDQYRVIGIVSEGDLMRRSEIGTEPRHSWWLIAMTSTDKLAEEFAKTHGVKASEIMTANVTTVTEDASIGWIAELLETKKIKRVPVVRDEKLVGIVSRANLVRALTTLKEKVIELPSIDDRKIHDALEEVLKKETWAATAQVNFVVAEGVVHLWGMVASGEQKKALVVLAENVSGVVSVQDHTAFRPVQYSSM